MSVHSTGLQLPIQHEFIYDATGRTVATRTSTNGTADWVCTSYDSRGRPTAVSYPAFGGSPARTVTNTYGVGGNPLVAAVSDPAGTVTTAVDLLGRVVTYTDALGITTSNAYDQAGRATTSTTSGIPSLARTYDDTGRLTALSSGGQPLANTSYDSGGRFSTVTYPSGTGNAGNGTTGTYTYDTNGRPASIIWRDPANALITSDQILGRDMAARITSQAIDSPTPGTPVQNEGYTYDSVGRLTTATIQTHTYAYVFAATNTCGTLTAAGKNTNRTSMTADGTTVGYCYDNADRLISSTDPAVGTITYDDHGNTTAIYGETHAYDATDRHITTTKGATTVTYTRDATNRIIERKVNGTTVAKYADTGSGDTPALTLDANNNVIEQTLSLPGGAMLTTRTAGNVWSYPNTHGDYVATANQAGTKQGATIVLDPFGNVVSGGAPDNSAGAMDYVWLGQNERPSEHEAGLESIVEMGARQYSPRLGRFLSTDSVEGGSANRYEYCFGDPVNKRDLAGTNSWGGIFNFLINFMVSLFTFLSRIYVRQGFRADAGTAVVLPPAPIRLHGGPDYPGYQPAFPQAAGQAAALLPPPPVKSTIGFTWLVNIAKVGAAYVGCVETGGVVAFSAEPFTGPVGSATGAVGGCAAGGAAAWNGADWVYSTYG
jgi:RHS repeat-associated protein